MNSGGLYSLINFIASPIQRLYQLTLRIIPGLRKLPSLPLPKLFALITFVFLLIIYVAALVRYNFYDNVPRGWDTWLILFAGVCIIPIFVYFLVKFWLVQEISPYPEIDRLWQQTLHLCEQKQISLKNLPIYLVLGGQDAATTEKLLHGAQYPLDICLPEKGKGDIGFYANPNAVFIALHGCSHLSGLVGAKCTVSNIAGISTIGENPSGSGVGDGDVTRTIHAKDFAAMQSGSGQKSSDQMGQPSSDQAARDGGTLQLSEDYLDRIRAGVGQTPTSSLPANLMGPLSAKLDSSDVAVRYDKLKYVCGLITKARSPVCPINGLVSLLPFEQVERGGDPLQVGLKQDLQHLRKLLQIRCPLMVLVTEMETDEGFQELTKRLGKTVINSRFGLGHEVWCAAKADRVRAVAARATASFEEWVYTLFQKDDALKQKYNSRLLRLLCRTRGMFSQNLQELLANTCGLDATESPETAHEQFLFAGCYFVRTDPKQPAFIKSVIHKLIQLEAELEWAPSARARDKELQFFASLFAVVGLASLLTIIGIAVWRLAVWQSG